VSIVVETCGATSEADSRLILTMDEAAGVDEDEDEDVLFSSDACLS